MVFLLSSVPAGVPGVFEKRAVFVSRVATLGDPGGHVLHEVDELLASDWLADEPVHVATLEPQNASHRR